MRKWKDLTIVERKTFIEYCDKKYGKSIIFYGSEIEPIYIDDSLNMVDNQCIIDLLFSYYKN